MNCENYTEDDLKTIVKWLFVRELERADKFANEHDFHWVIGSKVANKLGGVPPKTDEKMTLYGIDVWPSPDPWRLELWKKVSQ